MLMQKHSPNNAEDITSNSVDSNHSIGNFVEGSRSVNNNSEYIDDNKSSSEFEDLPPNSNTNTEQENNSSILDNANPLLTNKPRKKKKKSNNVKLKIPEEDKSGIKLKIRRTNNINQDENHVIVDNDLHNRKKQAQMHMKNKRIKINSDGNLSDDNLPSKRCRNTNEESPGDDLSRSSSVGTNTCNVGTEIDDSMLGPCQAGTKLTLESVVLMETDSGILILSVQWRGKTLMGALMECERFDIGSLEKDTIYRREKMMGINRRTTRRKSKNLFGKKKRKINNTTDGSSEINGGTENETGNSDIETPYVCDKELCQMRFTDLHSLRVHIYQQHRSSHSANSKSSNNDINNVNLTHPNNPVPPDTTVSSSINPNAFSPAYSDISDANEAPVLERSEADPPPTPAAPISFCHNPLVNTLGCQGANSLLSNRIFSPGAPQLQPEVSITANHTSANPHHHNQSGNNPLNNLRSSNRLSQNPTLTTDSLLNGYLLSGQKLPQMSENNPTVPQDLSMNSNSNSSNNNSSCIASSNSNSSTSLSSNSKQHYSSSNVKPTSSLLLSTPITKGNPLTNSNKINSSAIHYPPIHHHPHPHSITNGIIPPNTTTAMNSNNNPSFHHHHHHHHHNYSNSKQQQQQLLQQPLPNNSQTIANNLNHPIATTSVSTISNNNSLIPSSISTVISPTTSSLQHLTENISNHSQSLSASVTHSGPVNGTIHLPFMSFSNQNTNHQSSNKCNYQMSLYNSKY